MLAKSIAIIDDVADLVNLFKDALDSNGFKVCGFTNPNEALNHLQKNPDDYGLVISDYKMPVMNGYELCTKLSNLNPNLKVILMSAYESIEYDISKFTFLPKPIQISKLLKTVKETLAEEVKI